MNSTRGCARAGNKAASGEAEDPAAVELEVDLAAVPQAASLAGLAASLAGSAASPAVAGEAAPWFWAEAAADMTSIVRTARSTTLSATLPWMPRLTLSPPVRRRKPATLGSASVSPWVGR